MSLIRPTLSYATYEDVSHEFPDETIVRIRLDTATTSTETLELLARIRLDTATTSTETLELDPIPQLISAWFRSSNEPMLRLRSCRCAFLIRDTLNQLAEDEERLSHQDLVHQTAEAIKHSSNILLDDTCSFDDLQCPDLETFPTINDKTTDEIPVFRSQVSFCLDSGVSYTDMTMNARRDREKNLAKESMTAAKHLEKILSVAVARKDVQAALMGIEQTAFLADIVQQALIEATNYAYMTRNADILPESIIGAYIHRRARLIPLDSHQRIEDETKSFKGID
ncbi:MAG: hypothetical protein TREMPRED_000035 [Tremellales sp. Tagirdzhanova-0007]|nr:MAG: hypothetical protein TREMPRED_000035 [Tremellales sp. Tagirdzhanova-0007]